MNTPAMQPASRQPLGFWTVRAGEAIGARTRAALAELGVTQPEWWVLHQLSLHPDGMDRIRMVDTIGPNETPAEIEAAIDSAQAKGWLAQRSNMLRSTAAGTEVFVRCAAAQADLQAERMQGISDEDFTTTIQVLQRTIENVGGNAWHW
ncbi:MAG: MarR family winged helix-turn-helix transcriptional regulator [Microbacterium enclense]